MPIIKKVMNKLKSEYGDKKGESVYYALENEGKLGNKMEHDKETEHDEKEHHEDGEHAEKVHQEKHDEKDVSLKEIMDILTRMMDIMKPKESHEDVDEKMSHEKKEHHEDEHEDEHENEEKVKEHLREF